MQFHAFHLMPYRHLDFAEADQHRSYWVNLPNHMWDRSKGPSLYAEYIGQLVHAAECGFEGICVNEHHQTAYGLMPAPNLIASALIERTRGMDVKIAIIGRALPLVANPVAIAEEFAMLDNLSDGRIIAGFVRGIGCEYHSSMTNPIYSHERFHEAHDLIVQAWTKDGPFPFEGEHYNLNYVTLWPRPVQLPHPPVWIPSQGSGETIDWAAAPERKYPVIMAFSPTETVVKFHEAYRKAAAGYGYEASGDQLGWSTPVYVAETDELAAQEAAVHIEALFNHFFHIPTEYLFPPGYTSIRSFQAMMEFRKGLATEKQTLSDLLSRGNCIVGSPKTVAARIREVHERTGFRIMVPMIQFGTLPDDLVRKSTALFAAEVAPQLRGL
ncbi:MAG: flavin-dependent alkanal monooxygenase [Hyphomicrobiales bacterium]|nr:flavin-dependent alkanal monooxygenase [Hyphomicrobiales bacterium]